MRSCHQGRINAHTIGNAFQEFGLVYSFVTFLKQDEDFGKKESVMTRIALPPHLLSMRNQAALDAVLHALQKPSVDVDDYVLMRRAGFSLETLRSAGVDAASLRVAGWSVRDLRLGGCSIKELFQSGCTARSLLAAGFGAKELKDAGLSLQELKSAGVDIMTFKSLGYDLVWQTSGIFISS
jgi:ribosomal protein L13E